MITTLFLLPFVMAGTSSDFYVARENYVKGNYQIARALFEEFINECPDDISVANAKYYLMLIYERNNNFLQFLDCANSYLMHYKFGQKREEVFNILLEELANRHAYLLIIDYIKNYDYLTPDTTILMQACIELIQNPLFSDQVMSVGPKNDTLMILYAGTKKNLNEREQIYKHIEGTKGSIYLLENSLLKGDTLKAFRLYQETIKQDIDNDLLYRIVKVSRLFNHVMFENYRSRLSQLNGFSVKAKLLNALETGRLEKGTKPADAEELELLMAFYSRDSISRAPPENLDIDALLADSVAFMKNMMMLRKKYRDNFYLDSIYCDFLLKRNGFAEAYNIARKYLNYYNVAAYIRKIKILAGYAEHDYENTLSDIVMAQTKEPQIIFIAAECTKNLGDNPSDLYAEVMASTEDTILKHRAFKYFIEGEYKNRDYQRIAAYKFESFQSDTNLIKIYLNSLAHTGSRIKADSIYLAIFSSFDDTYLNAYGEYLIENKHYARAAVFYDSILKDSTGHVPGKAYFNYAMALFLKQSYDSAETMFKHCLKRYGSSDQWTANALFKIATTKYLKDDFDSAAYYYGLAAEQDTLIKLDALKNQLIAYKKAEAWNKIIMTGNKVISLMPDSERAETYFEVGYAYLRNGNARLAIENIKLAVARKTAPEYHYWLGEAYLGKGDFIRALYEYQKIVNQFPKDEMWYPTAEFKSGLALEFLDALVEARALYRAIVKKRGAADVWGAEAKKRLDLLK